MEASAELVATCACTRIRTASRVLTRAYDDMLRPSGLKATQLAVLAAIDSVETASIVELSRILFMDRTTLSRNLKPLAAERLITLQEGPGRSKAIAMTATGQQKLQAALPWWRKAQTEVAERISQERLDKIDKHLRNLIAAY